jgi:hypothetical protein
MYKAKAEIYDALEEDVGKRKLEKLKKADGRLESLLAKMLDEEMVKTINEVRKSR